MVDLYGGGGGVSFPVVFFDGETETDIGDVTVFPSLDLKRFQSILSQKIGISPHQFSVHLSSPESNRKIPISGKVNFLAISREKGCFFFVALKRSRRERRRMNHINHHGSARFVRSGGGGGDGVFNPPGNVMILKRDQGFAFPGRTDLMMEPERYLIGMRLAALAEANYDGGGVGDPAVTCEDCARAKELGRVVGFHQCVYDAVTFGFRSMAGPIARPYKGSD